MCVYVRACVCAKKLYDVLSSATKTALSTRFYDVQVSSVPSLGGYGPGSTPPAYIMWGGYNEQPLLRFSKISSVSGVNRLSMSATINPQLGITVVTVVRFLESIQGGIWSMSDTNNNWNNQNFFIYLSNTLQLCVKAREGHWGAYDVCTNAAVPINV